MKGKLGKTLVALCRDGWGRARGFARDHRAGLWRAAAAGGIALIVLLVHRSAYDHLSARPEYRVRPQARIEVAPSWGSGETTVTMPFDLSLLDDTVTQRVRALFEENPWIRRVTSVERVYPNQLRVKLQTRHPHLAIRRPEGVYLIDRDGTRLPGLYPSAPACERPIEVIGTMSAPPAPGLAWNHEEIAAGLELADLVSTTPALATLGIRAVDVSNLGGRSDRRRPETALITAQGCAIYWGRPPSTPRFGEPTPAEKMDLLGSVLAEYPNLDGLKYVKIHTGPKAAVSPAEIRTGRRTQQQATR